MTGKRVKAKEGEKLTNANIEHVIKLLEDKQPITKKTACEILNISYNTTRLAKIIEEYKDKKAYEAQRREKNRGKPAEQHEISSTIELYLAGEPISAIAARLYRTPSFVSAIIERVGVPTRPTGEDKHQKYMLPEKCIKESFNIGEIVWSAKYHGVAKVVAELNDEYYATRPGMVPINYLESEGFRVYKIYVTEKLEDVPARFAAVRTGGFYANVYSYEIGGLEHLKEYINLEKL